MHNIIFRDDDECSTNYQLKFIYDKNLKWADAFSNEVKSVRVYVFDENNVFIKEYIESGQDLASPDFSINLDLEKGHYTLIAWCGIDNPGVSHQSFYAPQNIGMEMEDLYCSLSNYEKRGSDCISDERLQFMFYGKLEIDITNYARKNGQKYFIMPLTKDTNHIRVTLVQLSGEDTRVSDFSYSIEAANGMLDYSNMLSGNTEIIYQPWNLDNAETMIENTQGVPIKCLSAVADIDVSRMTMEESQNMKLTIRNNISNEIIASVPIIDYALLSKEYYETAYGHKMTDQEFLDREDEYNLTFFLDANLRWIKTFIYINSWRIILHDYDV